MTVFVVEANDQVVAAIQAPTLAEARTYSESIGFFTNLTILERDGKPLWDGAGDLHLREATKQEQAAWDRTSGKAVLTLEEQEQWITARVPFGGSEKNNSPEAPWWAFWRSS